MSKYPHSKIGIVYYVSGEYGDQPAIKIGISRGPAQRARQLRGELLAWHVGTGQTETDLHARFADCRLGGEWFSPTAALLTHITQIQAQNGGTTPDELTEALGLESITTIAARLDVDGLAAIDKRAEQEDRTRSDMIRRMLIYAVQNMPRGWRP
jgi:hypothetical protein